MGQLIAIFLIIGILNTLTSNKKKKKQNAQKSGAQRAAAVQPKQQPKPAAQQSKPASAKRQPAQQQRIPFTKAEWKAYLNELSAELPPKAEAPAPAPVEFAEELGEGFVSTQGESFEEHAEHRRKIAEEEARRHQEREALDDLRNANLEKLRAAVVMSEVLGKPVALRPRTGYHR